MQVDNTKYFYNQDFDEYLKLHGTSFSGLKDTIIQPTEGMRLGTRVHNYLNEPDKYDWQQADIVLPIAKELRIRIGAAFNVMEKEVGFTADFYHNGMMLKYKGRADMLFAGRVVIDLKVLAGSLEQATKLFGYDNQISGYCLATHSDIGIIISYNKARKKTEVKTIKPNPAFWEYQCVYRGQIY